MQAFAVPLRAVAVLSLVTFAVLPAEAAETHTWVAANGSNANPCTRAFPCATFLQAYNSTFAGGEIRCADAGDFGGLTITKSITVDCEDNIASAAFAHFTVNVTGTDVVMLKGLDIHAYRSSQASGVAGVIFTGAGLLQLENVKIRGWQGGGGGLLFQPTGPAKLVMSNSTVADNGTGGNILVRPTTGVDGAGVAALFDRVTVAGSVFGIKADGSGQAAGQIDVDVRDSVAAHHGNNGFIAASDAGQAPIHYKITRSTGFNNGSFGAVATGAQAFMIVSGSSLTKNGTGLAQLSGSTVATYTNNDVNFNTTNVAGSITAIAQR